MTRETCRRFFRIGLVMLFLCLSILTFVVLSPDKLFAGGVTAKGTFRYDQTAVRARWSTDSALKTRANAGASLTISSMRFTSATKNDAASIWFYDKSRSGYVRSDLVNPVYTGKEGQTTAYVNFRSGAGTGFDSIKILPKNASITVLLRAYAADGESWFYAKDGSRYGYVSASYVTMSSSAKKDDDAKASSNSGKTGKTIAALNLRTGAGTSYASTQVLPYGAMVTITGSKKASDGVVWYQVKYGSASGYVSSLFVNIENKTASASETQPKIKAMNRTAYTKSSLKLRSEANASSSVLKTIPKSKSVQVTGKTAVSGKVWYRVKYSGKTGFVLKSSLTFQKPAEDPGNTSVATHNENEDKNDNKSTDNQDQNTSAPQQTAPAEPQQTVEEPEQTSGSYITKDGFPKSYLTQLEKLHAAHPNWVFTPVQTGLTWEDAFNKQISNKNANLIYRSYAPSYKLTDAGSYNYLTDYYVGKDSAFFVSASDEAVAYFMDPRNWLTDDAVFMFVNNEYHSYQNVTAVQSVLKNNPVLRKKENAQLFVDAGKYYNISPIYLAAKAYQEIGSYTSQVDGNYPGYKGYYNVFNVGAYDSANGGSVNAMKYAKQAGWKTLKAAVYGGASTLRNGYLNNRQASAYTEHFNVLNGLNKVGVHEYMTAVYAPYSSARTMKSNYTEYGLMNKKIEFFIPVYKNMPSKAAKAPTTDMNADNNYYLKSLKISWTTDGETDSRTLISGNGLDYRTRFSVIVPKGTTKVNFKAVQASKTTSVKIIGDGKRTVRSNEYTLRVKVKSGSGLVRTYEIVVMQR